MKKIYLFKHIDSAIDSKFVHFWGNDTENAYDIKNQITGDNDEQIVRDFKSFEDLLFYYYPDYTWEDMSSYLNIEHINGQLERVYLNGNTSALDVNGDIFIKVIDDDDNVLYYYNEGITETTGQNNQSTNYRIVLTLDKIAAYRSKFLEWCVELNPDTAFNEKTTDRFIWNTEGSRGYYLDYNNQTYLNVNFADLQRPLIKSDNDDQLILEELLYINAHTNQQYNDWYNLTYLPWIKAPFAGYFSASQSSTPSTASVLSEDIWKNKYYANLDPFNETTYNSNGLYRWLVIKTGDNVHSTTSGEKEGSIFQNKTMILGRKWGSENVTDEVVKIDQNSAFMLPGDRLTTSHTGKEWTCSFSKSFTLSNNLTADMLVGHDITINLNNKRLFNEDLTSISIVNKRNGAEDLYLSASNFISPKLLMILLFPTWYLETGHKVKLRFSNRWNGILKSDVITIKSVQANTDYDLMWYDIDFGWTDLHTAPWAVIFPKMKCSIKMRFKDNKVIFTLHMNGKKLPYEDAMDYIEAINEIDLSFAGLWISSDNAITEGTKNLELTGEEVCLIPVLKSNQDLKTISDSSLSKTIFFLNNSQGVTLGSSSVIGSLVNDIPPLLLAIASAKNKLDNKFALSFTNLISVDKIMDENNERYSPFDIQAIALQRKTQESNDSADYNMPVIFSDFSYIPITIARSPIKNDGSFDKNYCLGGNYFINHYYDLLTNAELTHKNTMESEPAMFNPLIYRWVFNIDGTHNIAVTGDMLNLNNLISDWEINLNTFLGSATYYRLDLGSNLRNNRYGFTQQFEELSSYDSRNFPFSTSQYYNWLENNQSTIQTAKTLLDRNLDYNMLSSGLNLAISPVQGALEGGSRFGKVGAVAGAAAGTLGGVGGLVNTILYNQKLQKDFRTEWAGRLSNMYRSPVSLNVSGFNDGSLNFAQWSPADLSNFSFFRTYELPQFLREKIWYIIKFRGLPCKGIPFKFADYDCRRVFNYFTLDTDTRRMDLINYIRNKCKEELPLFNSPEFIEDFLAWLSKGVRLWKRKWDLEKIDQYVEENIENKWQLPFNSDVANDEINVSIDVNLQNTYSVEPENLNGRINPMPNGNVEDLFGVEKNYIQYANTLTQNDIDLENPIAEGSVLYSDINSEISTKDEFIENYNYLAFDLSGTSFSLNNIDSTIALNRVIVNNTSINTVDFQPGQYSYELDLPIISYNNNIESELKVDDSTYLQSYINYQAEYNDDLDWHSNNKLSDLSSENLLRSVYLYSHDNYNQTTAASPCVENIKTDITEGGNDVYLSVYEFSGDAYHNLNYIHRTEYTTENGAAEINQWPYTGHQEVVMSYADFGANNFEEFKNRINSLSLSGLENSCYVYDTVCIAESYPVVPFSWNRRFINKRNLIDIFKDQNGNMWKWDKSRQGSVTAVTNLTLYRASQQPADEILAYYFNRTHPDWYWNGNLICINTSSENRGYWSWKANLRTNQSDDSGTTSWSGDPVGVFNKCELSWVAGATNIVFTLKITPYFIVRHFNSPYEYAYFGCRDYVPALNTAVLSINASDENPGVSHSANGEQKKWLFNLYANYQQVNDTANSTKMNIGYKVKVDLEEDSLSYKIYKNSNITAQFDEGDLRDGDDYNQYTWLLYSANSTAPNNELTNDEYKWNVKINLLLNKLKLFKL